MTEPRAPRWGAVVLALATALTFAPALFAGFLGYDDDWLVERNPILSRGDLEALGAIFTRFDFETRFTLGGEFLPVRDLAVWLSWGVLGLSAQALHGVQLALYVLATLAWRRVLLAVFGATLTAELGALLFAVHPVHAESVVWLAGMKDVLALLFTGLAVAAYARRDACAPCVAAFTLLACFSKGVSVVIPALLLLVDFAIARRPRRLALAASALVAAAALAVHVHVGGIVGMIADPLGGSRLTAASSMLVVFARYLGLSFFAHPHAVVYEVEALGFGDVRVLGALALFVALAAASCFALRRGQRAYAFGLGVFLVALAPVSQVLAPLQNLMADRYLVVAVLGPMVALAAVFEALLSRERLARLRVPVAAALVLLVGLYGHARAETFADPVKLYLETTERAPSRSLGPYQLAMILEAEGDLEAAEALYREAYAREPGTENARRAGNNLGKLLYGQGRVPEALAVYRALRAAYPDDPRVLHNLAKVLRAAGLDEEARAHEEELERRFPRYVKERHLPRYGPVRAPR